MTVGDEVLRAAVYRAFEAKGTPEFHVACEEVVFVQRTWPVIEYAHAIAAARVEVDRVAKSQTDGIELMRATYRRAA